MPNRSRTVFFVSDGTGITAEMLGHSLLTQFEGIEFAQVVVPFVDTPEKVEACLRRIEEARASSEARPIVFCTLVDDAVRGALRQADALVLDFFEGFISPLEAEFSIPSSHAVGRSHGVAHSKEYQHRIEAVNFALAHDDGLGSRELSRADVILVGVSRSGKTPTCLYMALHYGVKAANYPLTPEDLDEMRLPVFLRRHRHKLVGLSIDPERLAQIRETRKPGSVYASPRQCRRETAAAESLLRMEGVPMFETTHASIEEISSRVLLHLGLQREMF